MALVTVDDYALGAQLGQGTYGQVFSARKKAGRARNFPDVIAAKVAYLVYIALCRPRVTDDTAKDNLVDEIRLSRALDHPHIVRLYEFEYRKSLQSVYILLEFCNCGDLAALLKRYRVLPEAHTLAYLRQLASVLQYLRQLGVSHLDLKPSNILLTRTTGGEMVCKVADFGFAMQAPEMVRDHSFDARADLWSTGVILYEALYGRAPLHSTSYDELLAKILDPNPIAIPAAPPISKGAGELLGMLLQRDYTQRSFDAFFTHPLIRIARRTPADNGGSGTGSGAGSTLRQQQQQQPRPLRAASEGINPAADAGMGVAPRQLSAPAPSSPGLSATLPLLPTSVDDSVDDGEPAAPPPPYTPSIEARGPANNATTRAVGGVSATVMGGATDAGGKDVHSVAQAMILAAMADDHAGRGLLAFHEYCKALTYIMPHAQTDQTLAARAVPLIERAEALKVSNKAAAAQTKLSRTAMRMDLALTADAKTWLHAALQMLENAEAKLEIDDFDAAILGFQEGTALLLQVTAKLGVAAGRVSAPAAVVAGDGHGALKRKLQQEAAGALSMAERLQGMVRGPKYHFDLVSSSGSGSRGGSTGGSGEGAWAGEESAGDATGCAIS